ncbi:MAG: hypothetical protein WD990_06505 [Acidimicrobiia bacterium]
MTSSSPLLMVMLGLVVPSILLAAWWLVSPNRTAWWAALIWVGLLNLVVGATLTVLPLSFLPFEPEQSLSHYTTHLIYAGAQLPALYLLMTRRPVGGDGIPTRASDQ